MPMNMPRFSVFISLIAVAVSATATEQVRDPLVYKGKTVYPLNGPFIWKAFPEKKWPKFDPDTTANYKGHYAKWRVKRDSLFLESLNGSIGGKSVTLKDVFPGRKAPILATWVTDVIVIPKGKRLGFLRDPFRYYYEQETHLTIEKGKLLKVEEKTNSARKRK